EWPQHWTARVIVEPGVIHLTSEDKKLSIPTRYLLRPSGEIFGRHEFPTWVGLRFAKLPETKITLVSLMVSDVTNLVDTFKK
ncbi:hypothetical protein PFISCL1PPCAC_11025, partial [Pristionchus fissidentatus]